MDEERTEIKWPVYPGFDMAALIADPALRLCSATARGVWSEALAICLEATPCGHFLIHGKRPTMEQFAALIAVPLDAVVAGVAELEANGVFSRTEAGALCLRRIVREEEARNRAANGNTAGGCA